MPWGKYHFQSVYLLSIVFLIMVHPYLIIELLTIFVRIRTIILYCCYICALRYNFLFFLWYALYNLGVVFTKGCVVLFELRYIF